MHSSRRSWPWIRAALILLACIIGLLDGCPVPPLQETRQHAPALAPTVEAIERVRSKLLRPVRSVREVAQLRQRWALFSGASQRRFRLRVEGRTGTGTWQTLFLAGDDSVDAYAEQLHYRRLRGVWNPSGQRLRGGYNRFCAWMNARVLADYPLFDASRVVLERIEIADGGGYVPTGELVHERAVQRRRRR